MHELIRGQLVGGMAAHEGGWGLPYLRRRWPGEEDRVRRRGKRGTRGKRKRRVL